MPQNTGPLVILMETSLVIRKATVGKYSQKPPSQALELSLLRSRRLVLELRIEKARDCCLSKSHDVYKITKKQNSPSTHGVLVGELLSAERLNKNTLYLLESLYKFSEVLSN